MNVDPHYFQGVMLTLDWPITGSDDCTYGWGCENVLISCSGGNRWRLLVLVLRLLYELSSVCFFIGGKYTTEKGFNSNNNLTISIRIAALHQSYSILSSAANHSERFSPVGVEGLKINARPLFVRNGYCQGSPSMRNSKGSAQACPGIPARKEATTF